MATGILFGKYRPLRKLLASTAGEVYLALMDAPSGAPQKVIVKVLLPPPTPERVEAFLRDASMTAPTLHPSFVRAVDFGQCGDRCFVAIEPVAGATLTEILGAAMRAGRRLSFEFVAAVASQACAALGHAHALAAPDGSPWGLVHCDLAPQHLLACEGGLLKVIGFAMARAHGVRAPRMRSDGLAVNPLYAAPEHFLSQAEPDARSDLFSLGAVLWELVAGKPAFATRSLADVAQGLEHAAAPLTAVARDVPPLLADAIAHALELQPESRFFTADEMRHAFEAVLAVLGAPDAQTVIGNELRALERTGLALSGFEGGPLPDWFVESLGFDPATAPGPVKLPVGTALETSGLMDDLIQPVTQLSDGEPAGEPAARTRCDRPLPVFAPPEDEWADLSNAPGAGRPPIDLPDPSALAPTAGFGESEEEGFRAGPRARRGSLSIAALVLGLCAISAVTGLFVSNVRRGRALAASEAVRSAYLDVTSSPAGARLIVDGADTGLVTPARVEGVPGRSLSLVLKHPECFDWEGRAEVTRGAPASVNAELVQAAFVTVLTEPPGALVEIDGNAAFASPGRSGALRAGKHVVLVRKSGYVTARRDIETRDGERREVTVPLAVAAEISVGTAPSGAAIWVDGADTGAKSPATVGVLADKPHVITVRKRGFIGQAKRLPALAGGKSFAIELVLDDVVRPELVRRAASLAKDKSALEKKRDELRRRRKAPGSEAALAEAEAALEAIAVELLDMQAQIRDHEIARR